MEQLLALVLPVVENGYVPDIIVRRGIRTLLQARLDEENKGNVINNLDNKQNFVLDLKSQPIAISTSEANEQHYEVPYEFFVYTLDTKFLKYSCCYFGIDGSTIPKSLPNLEDAAKSMLELYIDRAQLVDGMEILELGCGWGSATLFFAEKFKKSHITAVSNSHSQKSYILQQCKQRSIDNVKVITEDMNSFEISHQYDRVISIEMFEHMKNYEVLLQRISNWLKPNGKLFVHLFSHITYAYHFIPKSNSDWMSKYFFTNGTMPSDDLLLYFQKDLHVVKHWRIDGRNYGETSECWLRNMDKNANNVKKIFEKTYGKEKATKWFVKWRLFFMAVAELFKLNDGQQWLVSHYLFEKHSNCAKL